MLIVGRTASALPPGATSQVDADDKPSTIGWSDRTPPAPTVRTDVAPCSLLSRLTIAKLPLDSSLFFDELFVPLLAVGEVSGLDQAIAESNKADYGLTAGLFSRSQPEIDRFFDEIEAGVCYVNKRTGATTGAWPGAQPFTGWKGSGSTGKGGCGPYYVQQFVREQSRTVRPRWGVSEITRRRVSARNRFAVPRCR